jgi:hypothetical protein
MSSTYFIDSVYVINTMGMTPFKLSKKQRASEQVPVDNTSKFPEVEWNGRSAHFTSNSKPPQWMAGNSQFQAFSAFSL